MRYLRPAIAATILLAVSACANREPAIYYGRDGGRIGYNGVDFDQANAECLHGTNVWANSGFGDPFYKMLSGGRQMFDSCMQSKGFAPRP